MQNMTRAPHIQPSATGGRPQRPGYVHHSKILHHSLIDVPCSVFNSFITDADGEGYQHLQYMPFGETSVSQKVSWWSTPYQFTGKEKDDETGYNYFGARYYNSDLSIWLSVDPLAHKYPSMSAYMYCAGNPVMLVDPDGREIILVGEDGTQITYHMGMTYEGSDKSIAAKINSLNSIANTNTGFPVVAELVNSSNYYTITNNDGITTSDLPHFCANNATDGISGGQIVTRGNNTISALSHELFHAYQDELGQGGASIHNEVEAYVFESRVIFESMTLGGSGLPLFLQSKSFINSTPPSPKDKEYENAVKNLVFQGYDNTSFTTAVHLFKAHSAKNDEGIYNRYPLQRQNQTKQLLKNLPTIR